jgi:hypothetical protein
MAMVLARTESIQDVAQPGSEVESPLDAGTRARRLLRALESYKASCAAKGEPPSEEDSWLVLIAALNLPLD